MNTPIDVTDDIFEDLISQNELVVLDCWAAWCGPCMILGPTIEELAKERGGIVFGKLNVDENRKVPIQFGIMSIPTLLYFKNGKLVDKTIGALPKKSIEERLDLLTS